MAYGQHQSFYLRDRWLNKGIKHLNTDERFFYDKDAFEKIGLGKNMVQSLRYWVVATGVVSEVYTADRKKMHHITELGKLVFQYDKFIKFPETASILHYHLVKGIEPSSTWYWYFNVYKETVSTKDNILNELKKWVKDTEKKTVSEKSLKRDIDCLVRLYTAGQNVNDPEEVIQSPLHKLGLVEEKKGVIYKRASNYNHIGLSALMYVLLDYKSQNDVDTVSVDDLVHSVGLWGKTFNISRSSIVNALNQLTLHPKFPISFIRTNNLDLIRIPNITPQNFIQDEYSRKVEVIR
ncbi:DUF4007 family protein [Peribacillus frigoritolerans]|uniref:DUF4007 family protein n=1 Tax=Peribacillus frigoritolerans TaxID=450367 RepID=UPI001EFC6C17|nr:DUF4007 family protein [Peribacillus frigoritolerans]ULM96191.1 DUF4007 family protein [Peribacillus frigoritolerans]